MKDERLNEILILALEAIKGIDPDKADIVGSALTQLSSEVQRLTKVLDSDEVQRRPDNKKSKKVTLKITNVTDK